MITIKNNHSKNTYLFECIAQKATFFIGTTFAFIMALTIIIVSIITGPLFHFPDTWQLVINTGTTIVTFLMAFLIQGTQNKDSKALHLKLNELIASLNGPGNRLVDIEDLTKEDLEVLHKYYRHLANLAKKEKDLCVSHSIEEAHELHIGKYKINN